MTPRDPTLHPGDLLSAFVDRELDPAMASAVEHHLRDCAPCQTELGATTQVRTWVRDLPPVPAPAGLIDGIVEARRRADRRGRVISLAAAMLAVIVGLSLVDPSEEPSTGAQSPADDIATPNDDGGGASRDEGVVRLEAGTASDDRLAESRSEVTESGDRSWLDRLNESAGELLDVLTP
jgi:hypothetical protein